MSLFRPNAEACISGVTGSGPERGLCRPLVQLGPFLAASALSIDRPKAGIGGKRRMADLLNYALENYANPIHG